MHAAESAQRRLRSANRLLIDAVLRLVLPQPEAVITCIPIGDRCAARLSPLRVEAV